MSVISEALRLYKKINVEVIEKSNLSLILEAYCPQNSLDLELKIECNLYDR